MNMNDMLKRFQDEMDVQTGGGFPVDANAVTMIFEDDACWIMLYRDGNKVIDVIYKDPNRVMDCLEIA